MRNHAARRRSAGPLSEVSMPNLLARLGAKPAHPATDRFDREAHTDALAARLGVTATPFDRPLCDARIDRVAERLSPAVRLAGGYLSGFPELFDAAGERVDRYNRYGGVPALARFEITIGGEEPRGFVTIGNLLGEMPIAGVELDGRLLPPVPLLDDELLFETAVALGRRVQEAAAR